MRKRVKSCPGTLSVEPPFSWERAERTGIRSTRIRAEGVTNMHQWNWPLEFREMFLEKTNISATLGEQVSETRCARVDLGRLVCRSWVFCCVGRFFLLYSLHSCSQTAIKCACLEVNAVLCCWLCLPQLMNWWWPRLFAMSILPSWLLGSNSSQFWWTKDTGNWHRGWKLLALCQLPGCHRSVPWTAYKNPALGRTVFSKLGIWWTKRGGPRVAWVTSWRWKGPWRIIGWRGRWGTEQESGLLSLAFPTCYGFVNIFSKRSSRDKDSGGSALPVMLPLHAQMREWWQRVREGGNPFQGVLLSSPALQEAGAPPSAEGPARNHEEGTYLIPVPPESVVWLIQQSPSPLIRECFPGPRNPLPTLLGCTGVQGSRYISYWENPEQRGRGMEGLFFFKLIFIAE